MGRSKKTWDHLVDYDGNYGIDIKNGIWPGSGQAPSVKGEPGEKGANGSGATGATGQKGGKGDEGEKGPKGDRGRPGFSLKGAKGDAEKGAKGDEGELGRTGDKGEVGEKGQKGDVQNLLHFQGQLPTEPDLPPPGNGQQPGDVWQIVADDSFWVWDGSEWVKLSEALNVLKGDKGDEGEQGVTGDKGEPALDGTNGTDGVDGEKGEPGEKGDEADKGEKGDEGDKGEKGDLGPSNYELYFDSTLDNPKLSEPEYLESLKGQKGDSGIDNSVLDNYYDQDEVDYLLQQYPDPPDAYDINYMDDNSVILPPGLVDFDTTDQNDRVYNKGMVTILPGCTIVNSPAPNAPLLLLNWVMADTTGLRDVDYTLIQFLFNADDATITEGGYYRRCTPGLGRFSPWAAVGTGGGSLDDYYTKQESDSRFVLAPHIDPNFALMTESGEHFLRLFTAGETPGALNDLGNVKLIEGPGIKVENVAGELKLSTTSEPLYLGQLEADEDPQEEFETRPEHQGKTLQNGSFWIYVTDGVAHPNVHPPTPGGDVESSDFCIYEKATDTWHVVKREGSGIQTISTNPHGVLESQETLEIDDSDPKNLKIKTKDYLVTQPQLLSHPRWGVLANLEARRKIGSLYDVNVVYRQPDPVNDPVCVINQALDFGAIPTADGEYSIDVSTGILKIALNDVNGVSNLPFIDTLNQNDRLQMDVQPGSSTVAQDSRIYQVRKPGTHFEIEFYEDAAALLTQFAKITAQTKLGTVGQLVVNLLKVVPDVNNGDILMFNSTTEQWDAGAVTRIGNFINKDGDQMPAGATHCWLGADYPGIPSKMCLSYAKLDLSDSYALSDRAGLEVVVNKGGAERPLALSTSRSTGTVFSVFSYESGLPNDRGQRFKLDANGSIYSNGSVYLDLSSATTYPAAGLALRMDLDGVTRVNYNTANKELSLSESLLRLNFTGNETSNPVEVRVGTDLVTQMAKDGVLTHRKRFDLDMGTTSTVALRVVGSLAVKSSNDIEQENSFYVGKDFYTVIARSTFERLDYGDDSVTFKILGKRPGSSKTDDELFTVYQDSVQANGDSINYYGRMDQDANILNKKFIDDNFLPYDISTLPTLP